MFNPGLALGSIATQGKGVWVPAGYSALTLNGKYLTLNNKHLILETANG